MIVMLATFGLRHPRTVDEHIPLDRTRLILAVVAAIIFALCFTPAPIERLIGRESGRALFAADLRHGTPVFDHNTDIGSTSTTTRR